MIRSCKMKMVACFGIAVLCAAPCYGQIVPYKLTGSGLGDPTGGELGVFYGPSIATHLGKLSWFAEVTSLTLKLDESGFPIGFDYTGIDTQTAADGSKLFLSGGGSAVLIHRPDLGPTMFEAVWDGDWNVDGSWVDYGDGPLGEGAPGGTGRFANAGPGNGIQVWLYQEPFDLFGTDLRPFIYTKTGDIDLGRQGKKK